MTIHELAKQDGCCTDKQNTSHAFRGENYLHVYERYFEARRAEPIKLLEIGVLFGWSLILWSRYFPYAQITGLDIDPTRKWKPNERIEIVTGDQANEETLTQVSSERGPFDIVIDDGSHYVPHAIASFNALFPLMPSRGIYVIEDTRCFYSCACADWPGMEHNQSHSSWANDRAPFDAVLQALVREMDHHQGNVRAVHFHPMMVVVEKV